MTEAFYGALARSPKHWPRSDWLQRELAPGQVDFEHGDFTLHLCLREDGWQLSGAEEAHAVRRRLWWLWLIPGLLWLSGGVIAIWKADNSPLVVVVLGVALLGSGLFFERAHSWRRGGTRRAPDSLYDRG